MKLECLLEQKPDGLKLWANGFKNRDIYTITTDPNVYQWHKLDDIKDTFISFDDYTNAKGFFDKNSVEEAVFFIENQEKQLVLPWVVSKNS